MKIGIIGAMDVEIEGIVGAMTGAESTEIGGSVFYRGMIGGKEVVAVQSGIGKVNAAFAATVLGVRFGVTAMLMTGVCGGIRGVKPLDAVVPTAFIQHDVRCLGEEDGFIDLVGRVEIPADERLSDALARASGAVRGVMGSGEQFVGTEEQVATILRSFPSVTAVDMESGAVAQVCTRLALPFACIKIVSDSGDESEFFAFKQRAAEKSVGGVVTSLSHI